VRIGQLRELARFLSIQIAYEDASGKKQNLSAESLTAAVKTRLPPGADPSEAWQERKRSLDERMVEPVTVVWGKRPLRVPLRLSRGSVDAGLEWTLQLEDGEVRSGRIAPGESAAEWSEEAFAGKTIQIAGAVPHGYHVLKLVTGDRSAETFVIAAPSRAPSLGRREWGVFLPLYAARTARNWGAGDLTDLQAFGAWVHELEGGVVATLPLLAGFDEEQSPYSPVSRLFWNEMYLDPTKLPEWRATDLHQNELLYLQNAQSVDYPRVIAEKRRVLEVMSRRFTMDDEFQRYARQGAYGYAHFRAAQEEKDSASYHLYVQYRMSQQMRETADGARKSGAGLYLDFPLGVNPAGFDAWKYARSFAKGVSVGAPPDLFFTKGQSWGFLPPDPDTIRAQKHDYFRACIRHHVSHAGILRIDHVMGLHRLFWIPEGAGAKNGFYVRYPEEELYAIVVLEATRHGCSVVGEDLGTVPEYVPRMMRKHGIGRMYVVQYEVNPEGPDALSEPAKESVASINTHDMPTFAGFWGGRDIDDRLELGLLDQDGASDERARREQIRESLTGLLKARGLLQEGGDQRAILEAILRSLAQSPAELVLVNLEDLWLETEPQNVPGVPDRSWKQKFRLSLEQLRKDAGIERVLRRVNEERKGVDGSQTQKKKRRDAARGDE